MMMMDWYQLAGIIAVINWGKMWRCQLKQTVLYGFLLIFLDIITFIVVVLVLVCLVFFFSSVFFFKFFFNKLPINDFLHNWGKNEWIKIWGQQRSSDLRVREVRLRLIVAINCCNCLSWFFFCFCCSDLAVVGLWLVLSMPKIPTTKTKYILSRLVISQLIWCSGLAMCNIYAVVIIAAALLLQLLS